MPFAPARTHDHQTTRRSPRHGRTLRMGGAAAAVGAAAMLALPGVAAAHVHAHPDSAEIGGYADLAFGVPHGCDGSPTTKVEFTIPREFATVTPNVNPNWEISKETDGSGEDAAVKKVTYTAKTPLPSDQKDTLTLSVKVADDATEGTVLVPTLQTCEKGSMNWASPDHDADYPAPTVDLVAEGAGDGHAGHHHAAHDHGEAAGAATGEEAGANEADATEAQAEDEQATAGTSAGAWGLGLGAVGAVTGITALLVALRKRS